MTDIGGSVDHMLLMMSRSVSLAFYSIPFLKITRFVDRVVTILIGLSVLALLVAGIVSIVILVYKIIRSIVTRHLPKTLRELSNALNESSLLLFMSFIALWWGGGGTYNYIMDQRPHPVSHYYPHPLVTAEHRQMLIGAILIFLIITMFLVAAKQFFLRYYAMVEFACGLILAGYSVWDFQPEISFVDLLKPISSIYFIVRSIENLRTDLQRRDDGTHKKAWDERRRQYQKLKWRIERSLKGLRLRRYVCMLRRR
jgi:signal transduction histidine kinase